MVTAKWGKFKFEIKPKLIRGFQGLTIKSASVTEDKTSGTKGKVSFKNNKPLEISLTALLYASTGCKVRQEAMKWVSQASKGNANTLYVGGSKLVDEKMMLTEAQVQDIEIAPNGKWVSASVKLTFKQGTSKGFGEGYKPPAKGLEKVPGGSRDPFHLMGDRDRELRYIKTL